MEIPYICNQPLTKAVPTISAFCLARRGAPIDFEAPKIVACADIGFTCKVGPPFGWLRAVRRAGCESIGRRNEIARRLALGELLPQARLRPTAASGLGERAAEEPPAPDGLDNSAKLVQPFAVR